MLCTYFTLCFEFILNKDWFKVGGVIKVNNLYSCRIDQIGVSLFTMGISQFVIDIIGAEIYFLFCLCCGKNYFDFCTFSVKSIILNMIFCACIPLYPFANLAYVIILIINFYYNYYALRIRSIYYKCDKDDIVYLL